MGMSGVKRLRAFYLAGVLIFAILLPVYSRATDNELKYYMGEAINAGKDTGYSEESTIKKNDPHFGWKLGNFYVSGFTGLTKDNAGDPVILKSTGDKVTLWFSLDQNISALNGDESLSIAEDDNGFDQYFGIEKTNFGKGTLIIRHTDYQNRIQKPVIYTDYLSALVSGADTKVDVFEEGDYEVALDYEVAKNRINLFGWTPIHSYTNYRIFFRFSVRNSNCMIFPFDVVTNTELTNTSMTENGFFLDLAKSRYLDISIQKEMLAKGADGLTEDIRFNSLAKDGDRFTDEGIYTITVKNRYTNERTVKKICVGTNPVLKAFVATGLSIPEIKDSLSRGAYIEDDGSIVFPEQAEPKVTPTVGPEPTVDPKSTLVSTEALSEPRAPSEETRSFPIITRYTVWGSVGTILLLALITYALAKQRQRKALAASTMQNAIEETVKENDNP